MGEEHMNTYPAGFNITTNIQYEYHDPISSLCNEGDLLQQQDQELSRRAKVYRRTSSMCERRKRRRILINNEQEHEGQDHVLSDEDLNGCIELELDLDEEVVGQSRQSTTVPPLDLYFARHLLAITTPIPSPSCSGRSSSVSSIMFNDDHAGPRSSFGSIDSIASEYSSWKIYNPGENPEEVKTKLRHWAQAVACSVMLQSF